MNEIIYDREALAFGRTYLIRYRAGSRILRRRLECLDHGVYLERLAAHGPDPFTTHPRSRIEERRIFIGEDEFISATEAS
jgi:hypothetical protein